MPSMWCRNPRPRAVRTRPSAAVDAVRLQIAEGLAGIRLVLEELLDEPRVPIREAVRRARTCGQSPAAPVGAGRAAGAEHGPVGYPGFPFMPAETAPPEDAVVTRGRQVDRGDPLAVDYLDELGSERRVLRLQASPSRSRTKPSPARVGSRSSSGSLAHVGLPYLELPMDDRQRLKDSEGPLPGILLVIGREKDLLCGVSFAGREEPEPSRADAHVALTGQPFQLPCISLDGVGEPVPSARVEIDEQAHLLHPEVDSFIHRTVGPRKPCADRHCESRGEMDELGDLVFQSAGPQSHEARGALGTVSDSLSGGRPPFMAAQAPPQDSVV